MGFFSWLHSQFTDGSNLPTGAELANLDREAPRPDRPGEYGAFRSVPQLRFGELPFTSPDRAAQWEAALTQLHDRRKLASKHLRKALEIHGKLRELDAGDNAAYYAAMARDARAGADTATAAGEYTAQLHRLRGVYAGIDRQLKAAQADFSQQQENFAQILGGDR